MNNHVIQSMTLQDAKAKCELAIECWANSADASVKPRELVEKLHHQIERLVEMNFDDGRWHVMKHASGAVFPVIVPDGQLNTESWEGLSMAACYMMLQELASKNPCWQTVFAAIEKAIMDENLEVTPCLVA